MVGGELACQTVPAPFAWLLLVAKNPPPGIARIECPEISIEKLYTACSCPRNRKTLVFTAPMVWIGTTPTFNPLPERMKPFNFLL
jgi:hypothetical protein